MSTEATPPVSILEPTDVARARPRVLTVFCTLVLAVVAAGIASAIAVVIALLVAPHSPGLRADAHEIMRWLGNSLWGVAAVIVPSQAVFCACALGAAAWSRMRWSERLALRAPAADAISIVLLLLGSLGLVTSVEYLAPLLGRPSEGMEDLAHLLGGTRGVEAALVTLLVSILPGVSEELLFRGYAQTRFVQRFGAARGIALAAVFFALAHFDLQHVVSVLPIGLWLGTVAWLTRSTWVSMAGHVINNLGALATLHVLGDAKEIPRTPTWIGGTVLLLVLGAVGVMRARRTTHAPDLQHA